MKVCLINPSRLLTLSSVALRPTPPLGLAYIAGALKKANHLVKVIDALAAAPDKATEFEGDIILHGLTDNEISSCIEKDTDVIGISCMFSNNWLANRSLIESLGKNFPDAKIIIGGEHATAAAGICLKQCPSLHAVILGEGEETVVELLDAYSSKASIESVEGIAFRNNAGEVKVSRRKRITELEKIPRPAWELFPLEDYMMHKFSYGVDRGKGLPIMATRGCPYSCTFCSSPEMWGTRYYMRSPSEVVDEIEDLNKKYQVTNFDFYDLTAIIKKEWIVDFCKELSWRKLNITWQIPAGTRSEAIDYEVAGWLYRSGCRNITYAPESGSPEILKIIKKKVHLDRMLESIRASRVQGINIKLNMIIGFPDEKHKNIWETTWFLLKASWAGAHDALPSIFSPYPGSALFERLREEKSLDPEKDDYWKTIIYADDFTKGVLYSNHLTRLQLWMHLIMQVGIFYVSNFLFRPMRAFRTVRNLITQKYESRAETNLAVILRRNSQWVISKETKVEIP